MHLLKPHVSGAHWAGGGLRPRSLTTGYEDRDGLFGRTVRLGQRGNPVPLIAYPCIGTTHMAKKDTVVSAIDSADATTPTTVYIESIPTSLPNGRGDTIDLGSIHPAGIAYLLHYGWNQSRQDVVAGKANDVKATFQALRDGTATPAQTKRFNGWAKDLGYDPAALLRGWSADAVADEVLAYITAERESDILSGKMDIPGQTNRFTGIDRLVRDKAMIWLKAEADRARQKVTPERVKALAEEMMRDHPDHPKMMEIRRLATIEWEEMERLRSSDVSSEADALVASLFAPKAAA